MARIIAGRDRGRRLAAPRGQATRPTGARVRQTLFDVLAPRLPGCRFLDAFAGSGAVGLEALSRGAACSVLVEKGAPAIRAIRENARVLGGRGELRVFRQDARIALPALAERGERFDVVYLDPPYDSDLYAGVIALTDASGLLAEGGVVVVEHFHKRVLPERIGGLLRGREIRIGDHRLSFYTRG
ncbi:MAG TPA: 16S rRNA (guanine(966)-N(2))-methyltransferase RsmD [Vicinamibacteria bacterium]|nr:16S rRNA (guanine(966)-N(2))-methyltransferase RsmD [Vicinamibacteria bacterium]